MSQFSRFGGGDDRRRAIRTIATLSVLSGVAFPNRPRPNSACQNCKRSKLVKSKTGARYCHRCGWFEKKKERP